MKVSQAHAFARSDRSPVGVWWWTTDRWMLGAVAALIAIGVMMSFAASPSAAARMNVGDPFHFAVRQCVFAAAADPFDRLQPEQGWRERGHRRWPGPIFRPAPG